MIKPHSDLSSPVQAAAAEPIAGAGLQLCADGGALRARATRTCVDLVLPVFDEERVLARSVATLRQFLAARREVWDARIVIADNGSTDATGRVGRELAARFGDVEYLRIDPRGRGRALRAAWAASSAEVCCYMDVDLSTDLDALPALIEAIARDGHDIATGCRLHPESVIRRSLKREILSRGYVFLLRCLLGIRFRDAQCGFKAVSRRVIDEVLPDVRDQEWFFDSELLFKCQRRGLAIREVPVRWIEDPDSRVKIRRTVANYLRSMLRLRREFATGR